MRRKLLKPLTTQNTRKTTKTSITADLSTDYADGRRCRADKRL